MLPKLYQGCLSSDQLTNSNEAKNSENTAGNMNDEEKPAAVEKYFSDKILPTFCKKNPMELVWQTISTQIKV